MGRTLFLSYLRRGAGIWVGVRLVAAVAAFMSAGGSPNGALLGLEPSPVVVAAAVVLGLVDVRLAREQALLGNLGVTPPMVAIPLAAAAVLGELILGVMLQVLR